MVGLVVVVGLPGTGAGAADLDGEPETVRFYMRQDGGPCPGNRFLSIEFVDGEPACGPLGLPFGELHYLGLPFAHTIRDYRNIGSLPRSFDAARDLTGNVRVVAIAATDGHAVGQVRVDVWVDAWFGTKVVTLGPHSSEQIVYPTNSAETDFPFVIEIPDEHDGELLTDVTVFVDIRGWHLLTGFHRLNGQSWLDLPVHPEEPNAEAS